MIASERVGRVVTITLDGTRANALTAQRYDAIRETASGLVSDDVLVLRSEGRTFCAGQDLGEFRVAQAAGEVGALIERGAQAVLAVLECRAPVVCVVQGAAVGAGALLAACADVLVLGEEARLSLPELTLGMPLGGAVAARLLPWPVVRRMMLTGEVVDASEVAAHGSTPVVASAKLVVETERQVRRLLDLDPRAVSLARQSWGEGERARAAEQYREEVAATLTCMNGAGRSAVSEADCGSQ